ncbi:MAG: hypothetical protein J6X58_02815, partial [Bacteroidales bacterium]|nr:hypothetical protein [Bacteroidales bacterium]
MRRFFLLLFFVAFAAFASAQSVTYNKSWVEYDVEENGAEGMYFHYDFTVSGLKGQDIKALLFIAESKNGSSYEWTKSWKDGYKSVEGSICVSKSLNATYEYSQWSDLKFFVPYEAMDIAKTGYSYYHSLVVRRSDNTQVDYFKYTSFDWKSYSPSAKIDKVWADHNVYKDGKKGMNIHGNVLVKKMKGQKVEFSCFIYDNDNNNVKTTSDKYSSVTNQLVTYERDTPLYSSTRWEDFCLFLPYDALPQVQGRSNYKYKFYVRDVNRSYAELASSSYYSFYYDLGNDNNNNN